MMKSRDRIRREIEERATIPGNPGAFLASAGLRDAAGEELRDAILRSDLLTARDRREFRKLWRQTQRLSPGELAAEVRPLLERLTPADDRETAWIAMLRSTADDAGRPFRKRLPPSVLGYFRATLTLDRLREERLDFMVRRYLQLKTIAGLIAGPADPV